ncbi:LysR substrate-binding domain-containing protein [Acinetobacter sp. B51(2017)]|uniref:LysR substrate-binding domain-containing protein n=1 Tax=Acinetobacter sp. B51(2017) TaxID=2060938 RepID=UPI000F0932FD|nr:LysR substrate-binding domain-containing protein [Acinetobacter sp. B51(2017)]
MDIKQLKIFITVVKLGSFSAAADQLSCTQPTITKAMQQLEQQVGEKLFSLTQAQRKRQVQLTSIGQHIYQYALAILQQHEQMLDSIQQIKLLKTGQLRLGLPPLGAILMHRLITRYHHNYPDIKLHFLEVGSLKIEQALLNKKIDVGIVLGQPHHELYSIKILNSPLCVLTQKNSHLSKRDHIDFHELKNEKFLFYTQDFSLSPILLDAAQQAGFNPNIVCQSSQWDFIVKMVEADMGIAILPEIYCKQFEHLSRVYFNNEGLTWTLHMAWHKGLQITPTTQAWLNLVEQYRHEISF